VTSVEDLRGRLAQMTDALRSASGVGEDVVIEIARSHHEVAVSMVSEMPPEEREKNTLCWTDGDGKSVDCLVPFDEAPEAYRITVQLGVASTLLTLFRAGFVVVRVGAARSVN
jgi:hypothetical protein